VNAITLPRSVALTDALLSGVGAPLGPGDLQQIEEGIERRLRALGAAAGGQPTTGHRGPGGRPGPSGRPARRLCLDGYLVRTGRRPGESSAATGAATGSAGARFAWSAANARRSIGLAAVRACLDDPEATPSVGVDRALRAAQRPAAAPPGSLGRWLATLGPGALAVTRAEAVRWSTALHGALDWARLGPSTQVGGADRSWASRDRAGVVIRGRAEVRAPVAPGPGDPGGLAALVVLSGWPGPGARCELAVNALAQALGAQRADQVPSRIAGWWPQSGRSLILDVDRALLEAAAQAVLGAAATLLGVAGSEVPLPDGS
jgi:hypothetical protein